MNERALIIDSWAYDIGTPAESLEAFAVGIVEATLQSWESGADLVLFPEFVWMGLEKFQQAEGLEAVAERFWQILWPNITPLLSRNGRAVVLGTVPWRGPDGQFRNRCPILCAGREIMQDKLHLTPWEQEFVTGEDLWLWEFRGHTVAVLICLDIEVPELAVQLRGSGLDLLLVPSATESSRGVTRITACARARAIELGCYVAVSPLVGRAESSLVDRNIGQVKCYAPAQGAITPSELDRGSDEIREAGCHKERFRLDMRALEKARRNRGETNPSLLRPRSIRLGSV